MSDKPVTLAAVTGAHGVAGEVRLKLFGEGVDALKPHKRFNEGALTLVKIRSDNKGGAIARFAEVMDRTSAEQLRGTALSVSREVLPDLEEDEFYFSDLIDLAVVTEAGEPVGRVCAVENYGATDIIEIEKADGAKFMVPLTKQAVPGLGRCPSYAQRRFRGLTPDRLLIGQMIADRGRRNAGLTHGVADLVETQHDIAGCEKAGHAGFHVIADENAVPFADICAAGSG